MELNDLKNMLNAARKEKDSSKIGFIGYLIGECTRKSKTPSSADVLKTLTNFVNSSKSLPGSNPSEIQFVESLLPTLLTTDEIKAELEKVSLPDIKSIMMHFKNTHAGKYDGSTVKAAAEEFLAKRLNND